MLTATKTKGRSGYWTIKLNGQYLGQVQAESESHALEIAKTKYAAQL